MIRGVSDCYVAAMQKLSRETWVVTYYLVGIA